MCCIECKMSKNGREFIVLTVNGCFISFEHKIIMSVARTVGLSERDVYSLACGDKIIIEEV